MSVGGRHCPEVEFAPHTVEGRLVLSALDRPGVWRFASFSGALIGLDLASAMASLPDGIDPAIEQIFARARSGEPVNTLCALAAESPRDGRRRGLAQQLLSAMRTIAERQGLTWLVAPVRPSLKDRYPLTPIERYITWRRDDGQLFDPWMRIHERLGARVAGPLPRSLRITGTVEEWESWTGMAFPESDDYVFPEGLATVHVDRDADRGTYWEPNVWMIHPRLETP